MTEQKWTAEQTAAIHTRGAHLLVSAAAGAGKTAVLVERIIRTITDPQQPVDIDQLLVVTFTNAAAAEMRERIGRALITQIDKTPQANYLQRQLARLSSAPIMTLHAFCLDVLRQYYYCIDLDPAFKIANDAEAALLRAQAIEKVFEELYADNNAGFFLLADMYGGSRDDRKLAEIILKLYEYSRSHPHPQHWLQHTAGQFAAANSERFEELSWVIEIKEFLYIQLCGCREKLQQASLLVKSSFGLACYAATLDNDMRCIEDLLRLLGQGWVPLAGDFDGKLSGTLPRIKGEYDEAAKEKVQQIRREVKKQLGKLHSEFFARSVQDWQDDAHQLAPVVQSLVYVVTAFAKEYAVLKTAKGLLDFSDLEHKCLEILRGEDTGESLAAQDLCRRYAEILVDEYQDINEVQEHILRLVSQREKGFVPMFMVGDVKQSIYRFRLADPSLFLHKYNTYRQSSVDGRRIDLACNFRSSPQVIDAINYLFRQIMTPYVGELAYDQKAQLRCGPRKIADFTAKIELHIIEKQLHPAMEHADEEVEAAGDEETAAGFSAEANVIAQRILEMIRAEETYQIYDKKTSAKRPLQYRDIVILLRATKGKAELLLDVLRKYEIPAYAEINRGYFAATEVQTMLSLLQIIDNPRQDIPLAAVLRSPVLGLQAEELAMIRNYLPQGEYWDALCAYAASGTTLAEKLQGFIGQVDTWRTIARQQPLSTLIWQLLQATGLYDYVGSMPGGIQRQANLRALFDRACEYEKTNFRGLFRFLRFMEMLRNNGSDLGTAGAVGENENVVRVMSVHKSKGLEFPVVFVANIGKGFNKTDLQGPVLCHKELGLGPDIIDLDRSISYASLARKAIQLRLKREALSEELRILYVALTRARAGLILVGTVKNLAKCQDRWGNFRHLDSETLPDWFLADAHSWLDWIAPAIARHRDGEDLCPKATNASASLQQYMDQSQWAIRLWDCETAGRVHNSDSAKADALLDTKLNALQTCDNMERGETYEAIKATLYWLYPYKAAKGYPAKLSVSELKHNMSAGEKDFSTQTLIYDRPRFLQVQTALNPAERGSALHLVMQHLKLSASLTETAIRTQIGQLAERRILTQLQAESVDTASIAAFFNTKLGRRMCRAEQVWRELKFSMMLEAQGLYPQVNDEGIFVQGVIDCLFCDHKGTVLLDYKTDQAGSRMATDLYYAYQRQLDLYVEAVEQLLKVPVQEAYLYFMNTGETVKAK